MLINDICDLILEMNHNIDISTSQSAQFLHLTAPTSRNLSVLSLFLSQEMQCGFNYHLHCFASLALIWKGKLFQVFKLQTWPKPVGPWGITGLGRIPYFSLSTATPAMYDSGCSKRFKKDIDVNRSFCPHVAEDFCLLFCPSLVLQARCWNFYSSK